MKPRLRNFDECGKIIHIKSVFNKLGLHYFDLEINLENKFQNNSI